MVSKLLSSLKLREVTIPNRIVVSPMQMYMAKSNGECTNWHLVHLGKFAAGKFGMVFTEVLCVEPRGRSTYSDAGIWSDAHIPMLKKISDFIKAQGSVAAAQIGHCGQPCILSKNSENDRSNQIAKIPPGATLAGAKILTKK